MDHAFEQTASYRWHPNGQSAFGDDLLSLYRKLDGLFLRLAGRYQAREYQFPTFISARELAKLDYFASFPQLVTFPVCLDADQDNLQAFSDDQPLDGEGRIRLTNTAPVRDVLTPAACYHLYIHLQGHRLEGARYLTTRNTCFRRETHYLPLQRQWSFSMREVVCLGTAEEVRQFLESSQARVRSVFAQIGLPVEWKPATDPFFRPQRSAKYLVQRLEPVKTEMVFQDRLAIGSVNFHRNYFGEAFQIRRGEQEAFSGCVAFGLERWMFAFLSQFGPSEAGWPDLDSVSLS
jgi:seryl-tRNA synthetase